MNRIPDHGNGSIVPFISLPSPSGFDACWAGEFSAPDPSVPPLICIGSVDGKLLFTNQEFGHRIEGKGPASGSGEAINGVAQVGKWIAVSTRKEVSFWATTKPKGLYSPLGAHGVATTRSGYFVAPLGQAGILIARPSDDDVSLSAHTPGDGKLYIYRVLPLRSQAGDEVLACAARLNGIAVGVFSAFGEENAMTTATFKGLDIIDLCPLCPGIDSLAVAALSRDGSIVLYRDVLNDKKPKTFKFQSINGVAYRIISHRGDIYVLTSRGIFVLGRLGSRFVNGETMNAITTPVMPMTMTAIDMNLAWGRWLLVVLGDAVLKFDAEQIHDYVPQHIGNGEIEELPSIASAVEPEWMDINSQTKSLVLAG